MKKSSIYLLSNIFIFFILPLIAISTCTLNSGGEFGVKYCVINNSIFLGYVNFYLGLFLISIYTAFIPIILYILFFGLFIYFMVKKIKKTEI